MTWLWTSTSLMVLIASAVLMAGCSMQLTPPDISAVSSGQRARVVILDHGIHGGLVLPMEDGSAREYAFGEWEYFALEETGLGQTLGAVFVPSQGTIARRDIPGGARMDPRQLAEPYIVDSTHTLFVEAAKVRLLVEAIEAERAVRASEMLTRDDTNFVPTDRRYSASHNCNHQLAAWLEALGVKVGGSRMWARFEVERTSGK
ncbi:MAG: hypothetical protein MUE97_05725 [Phycisphaerales bacterium]|jgi:hypothetical protein|nr:hypothetical protein [Phycisphaerales bacterium]